MRHQRTAISLAGSLLTFVAIGGFLTSANPSIATAQVLESQPEVGRPGSQPSSDRASNTGADVNAPRIAPSLPLPPVDENASSEDLLHAARSAIARGRTGEAQEAMERAQKSRDVNELERQIVLADRLGLAAMQRSPDTWIMYFEDASSQVSTATDLPKANRLVIEGKAAVAASDEQSVKRVVRALWALLPPSAVARGKSFDSGVQ